MQQIYSCPNCNSPVNFGDRFCGACGIYLNWPAQQQMPPPRTYQPPPGYYNQYYQQPGWGQLPAWGPYSGQQQQNSYGYGSRKPNRKGSSAGFVLLLVLVIVMMFAGAVGVMTGGTFDIGNLDFIPSSSSTSANTQPNGSSQDEDVIPAETPEKVEIAVTELVEDYNVDELAAEEKYKGNIYSITGTVASLSLAEPYFVLLTSNGSPDEIGAKCIFTGANLSKLQELELGQNVTIEGKIGDYAVDVLVNDCIFVN